MVKAVVRYILLIVALLLQFQSLAFAQGRYADTLHLKVYFEPGSSRVNPKYKGNRGRLSAFSEAFNSLMGNPEYGNPVVKIHAGASLGEDAESKQELSLDRAKSVRAFLSKSLPLSQSKVQLFPTQEDWSDVGGPLSEVLAVFPRSAYYKSQVPVMENEKSYEGKAKDTLAIRFRFDSTQINLAYAGNGGRVNRFLQDVRLHYAGMNPAALQWDIYAGASPEGRVDHNKWLGRERGKAIGNLISDSLGVSARNIQIHNLESRWADLHTAISESDEPWREEALSIIEKEPSLDKWNHDVREKQLRNMADGKAWPVLLRKYLSPLRSGGSAVVTYRPELDTLVYHENVTPEKKAPASAPRKTASLPCDTLSNYYILSNGRFYYPPKQLSDTLQVRFRLDSIRIDLGFASNRSNVRRFTDAFNEHFSLVNPDAIQLDIYAGASPEGPADHNYWLGRERGASIRRLIRDSLGLRLGTVVVHNLAARWEEFYEAIEDSDEPWKEEVLDILRMEPSRDPRYRDHREAKLRALREGSVWPVLLRKYLSPLRSGGSAIVSYRPQLDSSCLVPIRRQPYMPSRPDTVRSEAVSKNYYFFGAVPLFPDSKFRNYGFPETFRPGTSFPVPSEEKPGKKEKKPADIYPAWAVKTNLLFLGVIAPNIEVEVPIGRKNRWSIEWEYDHPWFVWNKNSQASQILNMSLELRLYLGNRVTHRWLDGWHIGLAVGGGKYDWEWKQHEGWQGEFVNAYFNVGYQHRFGKHWAVDAGLGVGVIPSRYRHYYGGSVYPDNHLEPWDIHLIYHDKGHFFFPGPTHVNVSIAYMFNNWPFRMKTMRGRKLEKWTEERTAEIQRREVARMQKAEERQARIKTKEEVEYARELEKEMKKAARAARKNK